MDKNILVLAYLGDSVYEVYIRKFLIDKGLNKVNNLQKEAIKYVSAKGQCELVKTLIEQNVLSKKELEIYFRGRNHKSKHHPKNTDILTYKEATGFEAIIGHLYLQGDIDRITQIINYGLEVE